MGMNKVLWGAWPRSMLEPKQDRMWGKDELVGVCFARASQMSTRKQRAKGRSREVGSKTWKELVVTGGD